MLLNESEHAAREGGLPQEADPLQDNKRMDSLCVGGGAPCEGVGGPGAGWGSLK